MEFDWEKLEVVDHETLVDKELIDHLQDGITRLYEYVNSVIGDVIGGAS